MATLVLTAAGSVFGPVGSAIGAVIGQAIDAELLKPKGRQGPRLQDLKIQTSSYGSPIPKLFGGMRVAGTVIWSTNLIERRSKQGGGKGRPSTTTYSYSASFAVLLSARPIRSVGRIWADGNLLRGAGGDWKSETSFRLHLGDADQGVDPFIASAEGVGGTSAYRGCAYAVFENMALAPFGNRIPSLTFEVDADPSPIPIGEVLSELSEGLVQDSGGPLLHGLAASGESLSALVETLGQALDLELRDSGGAITLSSGEQVTVALSETELNERQSERLSGDAQLPAELTLSHYDPARDYQIGVQHARRPGGARVVQIDLPAALDAPRAKGFAEDGLARLARERGRRSICCGWARLGCVPGTRIKLPDDPALWRVLARSVDRDGVKLELTRTRSASLPPVAADPGRQLPAIDQAHGPTVLHLLDLPNLEDDVPVQPRLYVAAAGSQPGWRRAALMVSFDAAASWSPIGTTAPAAVIGSTMSALEPGTDALFDFASSVDVTLLHSEMALEDASEARLLAGANLALIGNELIQFGRAEPLGGNIWRLSRLIRGRRATDWACQGHGVGERFVLIENEALLAYDPPAAVTSGSVQMLAAGVGDTVPVEASVSQIGEALRPPRPVHLTAKRREDGGYDVSWIRSSRNGWAWLDGVDAPLAEDQERYRLTITRADSVERSYQLGAPSFSYPAADLAADRLAGTPVTLSVVQVGTNMVSRAAHIHFS